MEARELLSDHFGRIEELARGIVDGLDREALTFRPDPEANSIAWLVWHGARVQDDHIAEIAGREQVWLADGWRDRFDLPLDARDTGYGHDADQVGAVQVDDAELLAGYQTAVADVTRAYLDGADGDELDRVIDRNWDPPVTVGVRLVSVIGDQLQHLGQAAYVRGLYDRS